MKAEGLRGFVMRMAARGGVALFVLVGFEIVIMISPFVAFFYSVFSPLFRFLDHYSATSWLTEFFLPHIILPPTPLLIGIRVLGSILFMLGLLTFTLCAAQVYLGKLLGWGIAEKGLYRIIRHPQYSALATWGVGMCILWPRFIVLASFSVMLALYYFLARDEEARMEASHGESYREYKEKTGMFLPRFVDRSFARLVPDASLRTVIVPLAAIAVPLVCGFALREVSLRSLPFHTEDNVTLLSILPEDDHLSGNVLDSISAIERRGTESLLRSDQEYLGYLMPVDYIMQGMIANTGQEFHLFKRHHTVGLITEWVLHPFRHLRSSPSLHMAKMHGVDPSVARRHHCPLGIDNAALDCGSCPYRRVVLLRVERAGDERFSGQDTLSFGARRTPVCYLDIDTATGRVIDLEPVEETGAWGDVPTPAI